MRYFFTMKLFKIYYLTVLLVMALVGLLTRDWMLALLPMLPFYFIERLVLDRYRPPFIGERRWEEIHYYQPIVWDGKDWVEAKEA